MDALQSPLSLTGSHSAKVQMRLHIGDQSLPVVQAGDKALKLRDHTVLPSGPASLEIIVDGQEPGVPDPRSPWQPNGVHGPSRIFDHAEFSRGDVEGHGGSDGESNVWSDAGWQAPPFESAIHQLSFASNSRISLTAGCEIPRR